MPFTMDQDNPFSDKMYNAQIARNVQMRVIFHILIFLSSDKDIILHDYPNNF